tara:strand:- start:276 stop:473 length:198 start_codon:yes stop_codon:yes gene_type:complete
LKSSFAKLKKNIGKKQGFRKNYDNMYSNRKSSHNRVQEMALKASDNGRCWWIYKFLMSDPKLTKR